jgi:hypothetical protein
MAALLTASLILVAACGDASQPAVETSADGPSEASTFARPVALGDLARVELVGPPATNAGRAPVFEWKPVADAVAYRLTVLGPDMPTWSWSGPEITIRYGGVDEGVNGPSLVAGSHWSVAALAGDGSVLALSELRPVSPAEDPGPPPSWTKVSAATPAPAASEPPVEITACDLLTPGELEDLFGREFREPEPDDVHYISSCDIDLADGLPGVDVTMNPRDRYNPDDWAGPGYEQVDGLGEDSYAVNAGILTVVGFVRGDKSVQLKLGFGKRALLTKLVEAAKLADQRLIDLE